MNPFSIETLSSFVVKECILPAPYKAESSATVIWEKTTMKQAEEDVVRDFFLQAIAKIEKARTEIRKRYPKLFSEE
jgi:hypothetical protein